MWRVTVHGTPAPKGNLRCRGGSSHTLYEAGGKGLDVWRKLVTLAGRNIRTAAGGTLNGPVGVDVTFVLARPKLHWRTGRNAGQLKDWAPSAHTSKPDIDKLERTILDALTDANVWVDDAQVADLNCRKRYVEFGERPGASIAVWPIDDEDRRTAHGRN